MSGQCLCFVLSTYFWFVSFHNCAHFHFSQVHFIIHLVSILLFGFCRYPVNFNAFVHSVTRRFCTVLSNKCRTGSRLIIEFVLVYFHSIAMSSILVIYFLKLLMIYSVQQYINYKQFSWKPWKEKIAYLLKHFSERWNWPVRMNDTAMGEKRLVGRIFASNVIDCVAHYLYFLFPCNVSICKTATWHFWVRIDIMYSPRLCKTTIVIRRRRKNIGTNLFYKR